MIVETVSNITWLDAEHTMFFCFVKYSEFAEVVPTSVDGVDPYDHIQEIWTKGTAGVYGPISDFVPPPPPPLITRPLENIVGQIPVTIL